MVTPITNYDFGSAVAVYEYKDYKTVTDDNAQWAVLSPDGNKIAEIFISPFDPAGWGVKWLISDLAGGDYKGMGGPIDRHAKHVAETHIAHEEKAGRSPP